MKKAGAMRRENQEEFHPIEPKILYDPAKWQPLIYTFRHYFGLGDELGATFRAEK